MHGWQFFRSMGVLSLMLLACSTDAVPTLQRDLPGVVLPSGTTISLAGMWKFRPGTLTPADLYLPGINDSDWKKMQVPANWFLQGHDLSGVVWFRHRFSVPTPTQGKLVTLNFAGVDYAADVWLNGEYLGFHEGYFDPFSFVVSQYLRFDTENVLVVRVDSPYEEPGHSWSFNKRLIKGVLNHHDTRPGGAWSSRGQEQNTGGIWAPVYLRVSQTLAIDTIQVTPVIGTENEKIEARIDVTVTNDGHEERPVSVAFALAPSNFTSPQDSGGRYTETFQLSPGKNKLTVTVPCTNPQLWSTWDHGYPHLYKVQVTIHRGNTLLDSSDAVFGFRRIAYDPMTKQWQLNGHRIFLRGTNYIATQWLSEMTADKYVVDVDLMKKAFINAVRVHAHVEAQDFYRLCDETGLLVWQDFPLQWGYTEEASFIDEAERQVRSMVASLFNHPSIFTWCLHNEPPWDAGWMQYKYAEYVPSHNRRLDEELLTRLRGVDSTRYVYPYSSTREHPWLGWYSGSWLDHGKPTQEALISEYGAQALPDLRSLDRIFRHEELWPDTKEKWEKWEYHNFQRHETFEVAKVPQGKNIHEWIANTQSYQATLVQFAAEAYRRQKFSPVTGIFQFMFVEDWPSVNWGVLDYWRNTKAGYFALQTAYQPVLPSIAYAKPNWKANEPVELELWVVNDTWQDYPGSVLEYALQSETGIVEQERLTLYVAADSSERVLSYKKKQLPPQRYRLAVTLASATGNVLGRNQLDFTVEGTRS